MSKLFEQIGRQKIEIVWMKKVGSLHQHLSLKSPSSSSAKTLYLINMGLFGFSSEPTPPIGENNRIWMEQNMLWLIDEFKEIKIEDQKVWLPTKEDFPCKFLDAPETAETTVKIIANSMQIPFERIKIEMFSNGLKEFNFGTSIMFTQFDHNSTNAGTYSENDDGTYLIRLDRQILKEGEMLIATIAHELAHIKLLGERRIEENSEELTDLATVVFGFGIFNANCSFNFNRNLSSWGYSSSGYLPQNEWGYALALYAYLRKEENPDWLVYLNKQVQYDFKKSLKFILSNEDLIFQLPE